MSDLLPIGRFARACRLSIKALRHYDELGLLRPARVDASGYRYYEKSQARTAIAIALLRSLDVPLPSIKTILAANDPNALAVHLASERARIEREMARAKQSLLCVERIIREGALMPYSVNVREEPARKLLAVTAAIAPEHHVEVGYELFGRLRGAVRALGVELAEPIVCLLPEPPDDDTMILQMSTPVGDDITAADAARAGAILASLPAGDVAIVMHQGPYEELGLAQHAVSAWVHERGLAAAGPMFERYVNDPSQVEPAELLTEVGLPLARTPDAARRSG